MILVIGGIKGGVGKSTMAANLAVLAARQGQDVLLADLDSQQTTMTWAAARADNPRASVAVTTIAISGKQVRGELQRLAQKFPVVIVDAGARDTTSQRAALSVADSLLLPFPPRGPDLWTLDAVVQQVEEIRAINPGLRAIPFVNRADAVGSDNAEAEAAFAELAEHLTPAPVRVGTRKGIPMAHLTGLAACEAVKPDSKAVDEIYALYQYIFSAYNTQK